MERSLILSESVNPADDVTPGVAMCIGILEFWSTTLKNIAAEESRSLSEFERGVSRVCDCLSEKLTEVHAVALGFSQASHVYLPDTDEISEWLPSVARHVQPLLFKVERAAEGRGEKVYFQSDGEYIKIGRTVRAEHKRRRENQTGNPRHLTTLAVIPRASEAYFMSRFKTHHVRGEWYRMAPEIMEFIRAWQLVEAAF